MLHEILFSLSGFPGGLLNKAIQMAEVANFIHPGERALIKKILDIASEYRELKEFIELYKHDTRVLTPLSGHEEESSRTLNPGLYLQAFCIGLDEALVSYRKEIVNLEARFLADPQCALTYVLTRVAPHGTVLSGFNVLIREILSRKLHGCQLLQLLYQNLSMAVDETRTALQVVLHRCHTLFFKQLSSWVLHGLLKDALREFFIQPVEETQKSPLSSSYVEYKISPELLPSYIPLSLAHKILFIGQTIVMISNDPRDRNADASSASLLSRNDMNSALWNECGQRYFEQVSKLNQASLLDIGLFDETIEIVRTFITEQLWELAVEQAELPIQMRLIKDMFLLGRGELFLEFIKQAESILDRAPSSNFSREINQAFRSASHKILLSSEEVKLDKFYFGTLDRSSSSSSVDVENGWTALVLHYRVSWPLHLVFTPTVLDSYNQLFGFLLRVKKTQRQLHNLWTIQIINKAKRWQDSRLWKVRTWLMFIVDHLQYYLQVDVLESQWSTFVTALESTTRDFEALRHAHSNFLASTLSQTFLLLGSAQNEPSMTSYQKPETLRNNPVHNTLSRLLRLCEKFCVIAAIWGDVHLTMDQEDDLTQLCRELDHLVNFLLQLLSSLRSQPCGTHLAQLLLRLDFNRWFSRQCTGSSLTGSLTGSIS